MGWGLKCFQASSKKILKRVAHDQKPEKVQNVTGESSIWKQTNCIVKACVHGKAKITTISQ